MRWCVASFRGMGWAVNSSQQPEKISVVFKVDIGVAIQVKHVRAGDGAGWSRWAWRDRRSPHALGEPNYVEIGNAPVVVKIPLT